MDRWTCRQVDGETERQRNNETERQRDRETERPRDRETERQRDRETDRRVDRWTDRQTNWTDACLVRLRCTMALLGPWELAGAAADFAGAGDADGHHVNCRVEVLRPISLLRLSLLR